MTQQLEAKPVMERAVGDLRGKIQFLKDKAGVTPSLKVILVGSHPPSLLYTRNKKRFCEKVGAACEIISLDEEVYEDTLIDVVNRCNEDSSVHGCFIQFPLPPHLSHVSLGKLICPEKDVDGFHRETMGKIYEGKNQNDALAPCTPKGVMKLLDHYGISVSGKAITIIGRSYLVGRPLAIMMTNLDGTVTLCHSKTPHLKEFTRSADVIVSAVGKPLFLDSSFIGSKKPVIVDVGINVVNDTIYGDVNFNEVFNLCAAITPVPGGVGPLTVLSLVENLVLATTLSSGKGIE